MLKNDSGIKQVSGITQQEEQRIIDFLQGAVYCWCNNKEDEWFTFRDFMGGKNFFWQGTPLLVLYDKHKNDGKSDDDSFKGAKLDAGSLLKKVLHKDSRWFDDKKTKKPGSEYEIKMYKWDST